MVIQYAVFIKFSGNDQALITRALKVIHAQWPRGVGFEKDYTLPRNIKTIKYRFSKKARQGNKTALKQLKHLHKSSLEQFWEDLLR